LIRMDNKGLFIDAECPCKRSTLYEYVIVSYDTEVLAANDFLMKYRMLPWDAERLDPVIKFDREHGITEMKVWGRIRAFTIADAFRYIQQIKGEAIRPNHRVLDFDKNDGNYHEISPCRFVLKTEVVQKTESEAADMFAKMRANLLAKINQEPNA